jgi:hypothetical protein
MSSELENKNNQSRAEQTINRRHLLLGTSSIVRDADFGGIGALTTFKEYPPSQRPSSFSIDQMVERMQQSFESVQSN